jgi:hypothetical protein
VTEANPERNGNGRKPSVEESIGVENRRRQLSRLCVARRPDQQLFAGSFGVPPEVVTEEVETVSARKDPRLTQVCVKTDRCARVGEKPGQVPRLMSG